MLRAAVYGTKRAGRSRSATACMRMHQSHTNGRHSRDVRCVSSSHLYAVRCNKESKDNINGTVSAFDGDKLEFKHEHEQEHNACESRIVDASSLFAMMRDTFETSPRPDVLVWRLGEPLRETELQVVLSEIKQLAESDNLRAQLKVAEDAARAAMCRLQHLRFLVAKLPSTGCAR